MRKAILMMTACLATAGLAAAGEPGQAPRHQGVAMLYFSKAIGGGSVRHAAPVFGLKLSELSVASNRPILDMLDLKLRGDGRTTVSALGLVNYRISGANLDAAGESAGGSDDEKSHKALYITLGVAAAVGVACLAEVGICESNNDKAPADSPGPDGPG